MSDETHQKWLQALKPGDPVFIPRPYHQDRFHKATVERVTKTQVKLHNGSVFDRERGWMRGGDRWVTTRIVEPTAERVASEQEGCERDRFAELTSKTAWRTLPIGAIREITKIIRESLPTNHAGRGE